MMDLVVLFGIVLVLLFWKPKLFFGLLLAGVALVVLVGAA